MVQRIDLVKADRSSIPQEDVVDVGAYEKRCGAGPVSVCIHNNSDFTHRRAITGSDHIGTGRTKADGLGSGVQMCWCSAIATSLGRMSAE